MFMFMFMFIGLVVLGYFDLLFVSIASCEAQQRCNTITYHYIMLLLLLFLAHVVYLWELLILISIF